MRMHVSCRGVCCLCRSQQSLSDLGFTSLACKRRLYRIWEDALSQKGEWGHISNEEGIVLVKHEVEGIRTEVAGIQTKEGISGDFAYGWRKRRKMAPRFLVWGEPGE